MKPRTKDLLISILAALALSACAAAEMASDARGGLEADQRRVTFSTEGGDCLRASDDPSGACLPNPDNCASIEVVYDAATGEGCEVCYAEDGDVISSHCGQTQEAECTQMENDLGETCTICRTFSGDVVYDTCHNETVPLIDARCESYTDAVGQLCEICYDEHGDVISRECFADNYWCEEYEQDGLLCRRCYEGDMQVSESCDSNMSGVVDPDNCTTITAPDGSTCYTCTDEAGAVVDHNCSSTTSAWCEYYYTQDGAYCEVCYDTNGSTVSHECSRDEPPVETCREYDSEGSICLICTDADGNITHRDCRTPCSDEGIPCNADADCAEGAFCQQGVCMCEAQPSCELFTTLDGTLCEICGDLNGDGFVNEEDANCFPSPSNPVNCREEQRVDQSSGDSYYCTVCESEGGGITEECFPGTDIVPPDVTCEVEQTADGRVCEVCRDPAGAVVHSSCDDLVCIDDEVPGLVGDASFVSCQICDQQDVLVSLACDMHNVCGADPSGSTGSGGTPGDPDTDPAQPPLLIDGCGNAWMSREPVQCNDNAWERWWRELHPGESVAPVQEGELLRLYYRETQEQPINILAYRIEHAFEVDYCTSCDCPRGDIIFIYVSAEDAERLQSLGWRYGS